jgi:hypothetical protein
MSRFEEAIAKADDAAGHALGAIPLTTGPLRAQTMATVATMWMAVARMHHQKDHLAAADRRARLDRERLTRLEAWAVSQGFTADEQTFDEDDEPLDELAARRESDDE